MGLSLSEICCLFCCPPCPSRIAAKLAFLPPEPTYSFQVRICLKRGQTSILYRSDVDHASSTLPWTCNLYHVTCSSADTRPVGRFSPRRSLSSQGRESPHYSHSWEPSLEWDGSWTLRILIGFSVCDTFSLLFLLLAVNWVVSSTFILSRVRGVSQERRLQVNVSLQNYWQKVEIASSFSQFLKFCNLN